jgi:hypothetical protein
MRGPPASRLEAELDDGQSRDRVRAVVTPAAAPERRRQEPHPLVVPQRRRPDAGASDLANHHLVLTLVWFNNIAGPSPPDPRTAPVASFTVSSLIVAWAY